MLLAGCDRWPAIKAPEPQEAAPTPTPVEVINIGVFLPLKGDSAPSGDAARNGLVIAVEEANASGGVLRRPVRLIVRDTASDPQRATKAVRDLIEKDNAAVVIGGIGPGSLEAATIANELGVPMIALGSTMPGIRSKEPWIFRLSYVDFLSGRVMAKFAASLGARRAVVLYDPASEYAKSLSIAFGKAFKSKKDFQIAGEPYQTGTSDFAQHINSIKRKNPDVIYLPAAPAEAVEIIKAAREAGLQMPFLGGAVWDCPEFSEALRANDIRNCYLPGRFSPGAALENTRIFNELYFNKFQRQPPGIAALGYDSLGVLIRAIRSAGGTDAQKLREALDGIQNFEGLTGTITIDPSLGISRPIPILKAENGSFTFIETLAP